MFSYETIEEFRKRKTPFYYYDLDLLEKTVAAARHAAGDFHIHYAIKANTDSKVLELIREAGLGADCVSGNEVRRALESGFPPEQVVFAGVGKSDDEINLALANEIFCFNCESVPEIEVLNDLSRSAGKVADIAIRINPNIGANTHKYITTGLDENKFGINLADLPEVVELIQRLPNVRLLGVHFHIGSQIQDLEPFRNLCTRVNEVNYWFSSRNIELQHLNVGGGLGVNYHQPDQQPMPDFQSFFEVFRRFLNIMPGQQVHFELGRSLVAQCGSLISRVLFVKQGVNTKFLILDAGMTELIRPALYQSYHKIENLSKSSFENGEEKYDVVGPVCESSDCFGKAVELPKTERGDLIAIRSAGAYGEVMASSYNLRQREETFYG